MTALFICLFIAVLLALLFGFFYDEIRDFVNRTFYRHRVYKVLSHFAQEQDQLLLNNVSLLLGGDADQPTVFDHILFADKYIYLVHDIYQKGGLYGNLEDPIVFLKTEKGKIFRIPNEAARNTQRLTALQVALKCPPDDHLFVSVVVYNSSLVVPPGIVTQTQGKLFVSINKLEKMLKEAEKDDVPVITHETSEKLLAMLKERSDHTKIRLRQQKKEKKTG
jgi:hypothetical protein